MYPSTLPAWIQDPIVPCKTSCQTIHTINMISALVYDRSNQSMLVSWQHSLHPETQKNETARDAFAALPADALQKDEQPDAALARLLQEQAGLTLKGAGEFMYETCYDSGEFPQSYTMSMYLCEVENTELGDESYADHVAYVEWLPYRKAFHEFRAMPDRFLREPLLDYLKEGEGFTQWMYEEAASKQQRRTGLVGRRGAVSIPRKII